MLTTAMTGLFCARGPGPARPVGAGTWWLPPWCPDRPSQPSRERDRWYGGLASWLAGHAKSPGVPGAEEQSTPRRVHNHLARTPRGPSRIHAASLPGGDHVRPLLPAPFVLLGSVLGVLLVPDLATASPADASATRPVTSTTASFGWPLAGTPVLDHGFSPPATAWGAGHRGLDLRAAVGLPVLAAADGRVTYSGLLAGRGVVVVAHTGGLRTTYEPVRPTLAVGRWVARGEVLGTLATGHGSCHRGTTCLHWGLVRGSTYLDPLALFGARHARLLPTRPLAAGTDATTTARRDASPSRLVGGAPAGQHPALPSALALLAVAGGGAIALAPRRRR